MVRPVWQILDPPLIKATPFFGKIAFQFVAVLLQSVKARRMRRYGYVLRTDGDNPEKDNVTVGSTVRRHTKTVWPTMKKMDTGRH